MKTILKNQVRILFGLLACALIRCNPDDQINLFSYIASDSPFIKERPTESIQPGIYKGEPKYLISGRAYSWIEFKVSDVPDKIGLVLPLKELGNPITFSGGASYSGIVELGVPTVTRGLLIFDQIVITYSGKGVTSGALNYPLVNFNFYSNSSPFQCHLDCEAEHARYKMPSGFLPLSADDGCVTGLGLLWAPEVNSFQQDQTGVLLGSANDDLAFYSPMASMEVLTNHPDIRGDIPQPAVMTSSRYYPTQYRIWQEGSDLYVSLERFVQKP